MKITDQVYRKELHNLQAFSDISSDEIVPGIWYEQYLHPDSYMDHSFLYRSINRPTWIVIMRCYAPTLYGSQKDFWGWRVDITHYKECPWYLLKEATMDIAEMCVGVGNQVEKLHSYL